MKIKLLPLAVAAAMAAPAVVLADGPTVYGHLKVSYDYYDYESDDVWELNSHASRVGVKGSNSINNDLEVFYQAEFGVDVDEGRSKVTTITDTGYYPGAVPGDDPYVNRTYVGETFSQRDIFVGLRGGWGAIQAGRFDTPLKKSQGKVDQFNDMIEGDIENVIVGEFRADNIVQYSTPKIADAVTVNVAFMPGEEFGGDNDGPADSFSISAVFEQGNLYGAIAYDDEVAGWDTLRLTGAITLDQLQLGVILQKAELSDDNDVEDTGAIASAAFALDDHNKVRAQLGYSKYEDGNVYDQKITFVGLGYDHMLTKQTRLFANYIYTEDKDTVRFVSSVTDKSELNALQLGIEHNF